MIPKSVQRFSEKIMLKQEARAGIDLVSLFRSSHHCAAHWFANFGIKGTPAIYDSRSCGRI